MSAQMQRRVFYVALNEWATVNGPLMSPTEIVRTELFFFLMVDKNEMTKYPTLLYLWCGPKHVFFS